MGGIEQIVKEIAVPLTGWVVTNDEARTPYEELMSLSESGTRNDSLR